MVNTTINPCSNCGKLCHCKSKGGLCEECFASRNGRGFQLTRVYSKLNKQKKVFRRRSLQMNSIGKKKEVISNGIDKDLSIK